MPGPSVRLSEQEIDVAFRFVEETGVSEFFPKTFEVAALRHCWDRVWPVLAGIELLSYQPRECVEMIAPKQRLLVRPVHLLDPVDAILYTGLTFRLAPAIQGTRDTYKADRVFSWHYDRTEKGSRDALQSDWDGFQERTRAL